MPRVRSFPELIQWLANTYHNGAVYRVADGTGLSPATMDKWVKGRVRSYRFDSLAKFAARYKLDPVAVY